MRQISITHGLMEMHRKQIEESRLRTIYDAFGVGTMKQLQRVVKDAQEAKERAKQANVFGGLMSAAQSSGLKMAQVLGERFNQTKTFGGAIPTEEEFQRQAEMMNQSPLGKIWREMREYIEQQEAEEERRESLQSIIRRHQKEFAETFARPMPRFEVEPVRLLRPVKINLEINIVINPPNSEPQTA